MIDEGFLEYSKSLLVVEDSKNEDEESRMIWAVEFMSEQEASVSRKLDNTDRHELQVLIYGVTQIVQSHQAVRNVKTNGVSAVYAHCRYYQRTFYILFRGSSWLESA